MNFPFFIARRIYSDSGDHRKVSRPAIRIATIGVAIGLAVMIITVSVVMGFKHSIRDKWWASAVISRWRVSSLPRVAPPILSAWTTR